MNPFTSIPVKKPKLNRFKLDNTQYLSTGFGLLTPNLVLDAIPGDIHHIEMAHLIRTEPLVSPTYGKIDIIQDFYKIPYRILTDRKSYDQFFTGGVSGDVNLDLPYFTYEDIMIILFHYFMPEARWLLSELFYSNDHQSRNNIYMNNDFSSFRYFFNLLDNLGYPVLGTFLDIYSLPFPFLNRVSDISDIPAGVRYYPVLNNTQTVYIFVSDDFRDYKFNALSLLAFIRVYYDNYIDQNLQSDLFEYLGTIFDSNNMGKSFSEIFSELFNENESLYNSFVNGVLYRSFRKNYYSSVLPNSQRGNQITVPLGDITTVGSTINIQGSDLNTRAVYTTNINGKLLGYEMLSGDSLQDAVDRGNPFSAELVSNGNLSPIAITAIRTALKLQQWLEKNNIAGSRYFEHLLAHFGVAPDDRSLQRSEYLGGNLTDLGISIVENTNMSSDSSPLGELAGRGTSTNFVKLKSVICDEHCIILGISTIMPRPLYTQSVSRFIFKRDKFDLFYPEFQHIGEQEIPIDEIFFNPSFYESGEPHAGDTYGYQQRFGEYKFMRSGVHGSFRGSDASYVCRFPILNLDYGLSIDKIQCRPEYFSYMFNYSGAQEQIFKCMFQYSNHNPDLK